LALVVLAACQPPAGSQTTRAAQAAQSFTLAELVGSWRWIHRTTEAGTTRIESERWTFLPMPNVPTKLVGRYVRHVDVRSDDRVVFQCNQRPTYQQRAVFDVEVEIAQGTFTVRETSYHADVSPCDHGFRKTGTYTATLAGERLDLRWGDLRLGGGAQTLWRVADATGALPGDPWSTTPEIEGAWRWDMTSFDAEGNVHDESEWWQITRRRETQLDLTYRRRVVVRSPDGKPITCAGTPTWSFDDAYVLEGQREEEHWHFYERATEPGDHPCLRVAPRRALDEATAEQLGDYLVLECRGKRRQVLYRPER
ncbi:MAG TPA: hypothetical protein VK427_03700, partial [Kofleriaceae bacterium]|nr:hypothetical protein [Kofleriaceae bacterium]